LQLAEIMHDEILLVPIYYILFIIFNFDFCDLFLRTLFNIRQSRKAPTDQPRKPTTKAGQELMMELGKSLIKRCITLKLCNEYKMSIIVSFIITV